MLRVLRNHILILLNWFSKRDNSAELGKKKKKKPFHPPSEYGQALRSLQTNSTHFTQHESLLLLNCWVPISQLLFDGFPTIALCTGVCR